MKNLFLLVLFFSVFVGATKGADPLLAIKLNNTNTLEYCTESKSIAELLSIEVAGTPNINGFKISFSEGYKFGEDKLEVLSPGTLSQNWSAATGSLELTGSTVIQDYVSAIKTIQYINLKPIPTLGVRKITISLNDVDYLPETKHFYRFVSKPNIKWTDAETEAKSDAMMYYGLRGYLANITSKAENDFINLKTQGLGWIGASDHAVEGEWRWVTGPEGLEEGAKGRLFWKGTGGQAKSDPANYGSINGAYQNWNRWDTPPGDQMHYEPNDYSHTNIDHEEDYAHITFSTNPNETLKWNDYPNNGGSAGYLIEFGGMQDDPRVELSATLELQVNTMSFKNPGVQPAICEGKSIELNQADLTSATYIWSPTELLSSPSNIANPVATPTSPLTTYKVTGTRGGCINFATYTFSVNPKPVSLLKAEYNTCNGDKITLNPGVQKSYSWSTGSTAQTIDVDITGDYSVTLTTDKGCTAPSFITKVVVHEYPKIDLLDVQKLICGDTKTSVNFIPAVGTEYSLTSVDGKAQISNKLDISVPDFGIYPMVYNAAIYPGCPVTKNFDLAFYKTPTVGLSIKPGECQRYNLDASYNGDADLSKARFTWIFGGDTIAYGIGLVKEKIPLGINQSKRDLVLLVEQDGCSNKDVIPEILAIPTLNVSVAKSTLCQPESFDFLATNSESGVNANYDWNFGDGNTGTGDKPAHIYANAGKYDVQVTVTTDKNCTNTALINEMVFVAPIPDVAFSLSPLTCLYPGINTIAYAGLVGTTNDKYIWDTTNLDPSEIVTDPGEKQGPWTFDLKTKPQATIGLKVISEYRCESLPGSISLKRKPDFSINTSTTEGCIPFEPTLSGLINVNDHVDKVDFTWDFGDGSTGTGYSVPHTYFDPGKSYNIILMGKSSLTQCINELSENSLLKTYPKPKAAFSMDHKVVYNDQPGVKFTDLSTGKPSAWLWDFGDGVTADIQNPIYNFVKMGHQRVMLEVTNDELCTDTVSHNILVAFDRLFPPNGFSPNASNVEDRVFLLNSEGIVPEGYHFTVLSRWNDLIFEAKDEIKGWDGRMKNGSLAPAGAYVWILNFNDFLGRKHRQTGAVTLVY